MSPSAPPVSRATATRCRSPPTGSLSRRPTPRASATGGPPSPSSPGCTTAGSPSAPCRDWPDLAERGVMLDVSRDKVPTMATLYEIVDRLAEWKVNHLELYAEHTFAYADHELVWQDASPLTAAEIRELDAYCRGPARGARPEPELPRAHEPLAAPRAVPGVGDGSRGLRDDGHAATAQHDRADRSRVAGARTRPARGAAPQLLGLPVRARRARRAVGAASRAVRRLPRLGVDAAGAAGGRRSRAARLGRHPRPAS